MDLGMCRREEKKNGRRKGKEPDSWERKGKMSCSAEKDKEILIKGRNEATKNAERWKEREDKEGKRE